MEEKLRLDSRKIARARKAAADIAADVDRFIADRTTVAVERTVLRLMGIDGVDAEGVPLPNVLVDHIRDSGGIGIGAAPWVINAMLHTGAGPREVAEGVATGSLDLARVPWAGLDAIRRKGKELAEAGLGIIERNRREREERIRRLGEGKQPYLYVIVATGDIYEDAVQGKA
ncbi:MAG: lysine 5,6-aminomutase subunit alpha, partial [Planifilum fimeticola]